MIQAKIVADSASAVSGDRLTTMLITLPRHILAELNTHRMLSKNSASSRAIPFKKMVESVKTNPFIPIVWQRDHSGMQGTEYFNDSDLYIDTGKETIVGDFVTPIPIQAKIAWLEARDNAIIEAKYLNDLGVTKQLCNRLLEPFMYHTVLISGTEWENFFSLRCPEYSLFSENMPMAFRSKKDLLKYVKQVEADEFKNQYDNLTDLDWLTINKGQAEIHMMSLAEAMWDAMNESKPKELRPGEWHIPFEDKIDIKSLEKTIDWETYPLDGSGTQENINNITVNNIKKLLTSKIKVSTTMAARTSYTVVGDVKKVDYDKLIEIHDRMANQVPFHASPFEHCARVMEPDEYELNVKGEVCLSEPVDTFRTNIKGWCRNYKGFIQYRHIIETSRIY